MAYYLVIKGPDEKILTVVPVPPGYKTIEVSDRQIQEMNKILPPDKRINLAEHAGGSEKVG